MYKIIEGKIYNISESEKIYEYTTITLEATYEIEATTIKREVYRTKKDNFFIIERHMGRQRFIPMEKGEVIFILETEDEVELIKEYFPEYYKSLIEM